jgi:superfamily II DNA or RNA helicase
VLRLRPLTGADGDVAGVFLPLGEEVRTAEFEPPDPARAGDLTAGLLLSDAARLSLRAAAAPFRSLARLAVTPRPYQLVPLIMALRLDPVRLLIADDVGVGKTIEAALIARELLDRGIVRRIGVLCPAHLCEQWETELSSKFTLGAKVVQPATRSRLERELPRPDLSIFAYYPHLIASIDYVKFGTNRDWFLTNAPDLIIVDEAHTAARPRGGAKAPQHQRYELLRDLAADPNRHLLLVTATPHSGIEDGFRSLLGLLRPEFDLPEVGGNPDIDRRDLLPHVVQRPRKYVEHWLGAPTPFPERQPQEIKYTLSPAYQSLFEDVVEYCRETYSPGAAGESGNVQRVRYWGAFATLLSVLSSPAAARSTLGNRDGSAKVPQAFDSLEEVDNVFAPLVLNTFDQEAASDVAPTAPLEEAEAGLAPADRRKLAGFRQQAEALAGPEHDVKLARARDIVAWLLRDGYHPIVFCHYIATAEYLADWLQRLLEDAFHGLHVVAVTGSDGDDVRKRRVAELSQEPLRVLVATDCLSEGINLQEHFDAVVHYDLPWNPNRLEQREGRVDRFGQPRAVVKTVVLYGTEVDQVVLDVLIRKAREIQRDLGTAVPVPGLAELVVQAVVETVLLREAGQTGQQRMSFGEPEQLRLGLEAPGVSRVHEQMDQDAQREKEQRAYFSQHGIRAEEVERELNISDPVLGNAGAVRSFVARALQRWGGELKPTKTPDVFELHPGELGGRFASREKLAFPLKVTFSSPEKEGVKWLGRTSPIVTACCDAVLGQVLAEDQHDPLFSRCGAVYTDQVQVRTVVLVLRLRYLLQEEEQQFAEEVLVPAFVRQEGRLRWLDPLESGGRGLFENVKAVAPMPQAERRAQVAWALDFLQARGEWYADLVADRELELSDSHNRLRKLARASAVEITPHVPPDILGCYVLVPGGAR